MNHTPFSNEPHPPVYAQADKSTTLHHGIRHHRRGLKGSTAIDTCASLNHISLITSKVIEAVKALSLLHVIFKILK